MVPRRLTGPSAVRRLGGLRWRLTASYALVTLVAAATMSAAVTATQAARGVASADEGGPAIVLEKSAGAAAAYFTGPLPDPEALRFWIAIPLMDDLSRHTHSRPLAVAVLDRDGALLATTSCTHEEYNASTAATCQADARVHVDAFLADPAGRQAMRSAAENPVPGQEIVGAVSGRGFVATQILRGKQPGGTLVTIFQSGVPARPPQHPLGTFLTLWKTNWSPTWLPMIILAIIIGTATGLTLSHQLVRRLRTMATTTRTWSLGDLRPVVEVRGRDELAHLGADLNHMAGQIRNLLAARQQIATLRERHRVQRDLHDGVKQDLFAAGLYLSAAKTSLPSEATATLNQLDDAHESTRRAQRELTAIIEQLRPPPLSPNGLAGAIAELCAHFETQAGFPVQHDVPADLDLPTHIEEALTRVSQEALTNIRRHANANAAAISVTTSDNQLTLHVTDNGCGLPADPERVGGLGLISMRERAEAVHGSIRIYSTHPGTRVEVIVPTTDAGMPDE